MGEGIGERLNALPTSSAVLPAWVIITVIEIFVETVCSVPDRKF